jgi:hypothetical protein
MDHDDLIMAASRYQYFWLTRELSGMDRDLTHIWGGAYPGHPIQGEVAALRGVYRVGDVTAEAGLRTMQQAVIDAHRATQEQIDTNPEFRKQFYVEFLKWHRDFDHLYATFLQRDPSQEEQWKAEAREYLRGRGCGDELIDDAVSGICRNRRFLERMRFLFLPEYL